MRCKVYLAGPMRGKPRMNFDAFYEAEARLADMGWDVWSPARSDALMGFDPDKHDLSWFEDRGGMRGVAAKDLTALLDCYAIYMLQGWDTSVGATAEHAVASWIGMDIMYEVLPDVEAGEDILQEAYKLTRGDRQATYGPPTQDFARTSKMWSALKGVEFEPRDVALFMIALKLSRETHMRKRDNWVDIAGYARCGQLCNEASGGDA